jgi:hypothetical protein
MVVSSTSFKLFLQQWQFPYQSVTYNFLPMASVNAIQIDPGLLAKLLLVA